MGRWVEKVTTFAVPLFQFESQILLLIFLPLSSCHFGVRLFYSDIPGKCFYFEFKSVPRTLHIHTEHREYRAQRWRKFLVQPKVKCVSVMWHTFTILSYSTVRLKNLAHRRNNSHEIKLSGVRQPWHYP